MSAEGLKAMAVKAVQADLLGSYKPATPPLPLPVFSGSGQAMRRTRRFGLQ